jgi:alpha-tubulin suppressor-like RCC1 family protein
MLLFLLASSCVPDTLDPDVNCTFPCQSNTDCKAGYACVGNLCTSNPTAGCPSHQDGDAGTAGDGDDGPERDPFPQVSAGAHHTCAQPGNRTLYCWGDNTLGQLGTGSAGPGSLSPVEVDTGNLPHGDSFWKISAGDNHTCAIATSGRVYCWGDDSHGQVGEGGGENECEGIFLSYCPLPVEISDTYLADEREFIHIAAGRLSTCGITEKGKPYCWGSNEYGLLGNGDPVDSHSTEPVPVQAALPDWTFKSIAVGAWHACGITTGGDLYCWGANQRGQLGTGNLDSPYTVPVGVDSGLTFSSVTAGEGHTCALTEAGTALCWGQDDFGQLGNSASHDDKYSPYQVTNSSMANASRIVAGGHHTCAIGQSQGVTYCWGRNDTGQVGNEITTTNKQDPFPVDTNHIWETPPEWTWLAAGLFHSCGIADGDVYCWGDNASGKLGLGHDHGGVTTPAYVNFPTK